MTAKAPPRPAVFFDRDGTLNVEVDFLRDPDDLVMLPGAAAAVARVNAAGLPAVLVTNQSGIARGYLDEARLAEIHERLARELERESARLDLVLYSPYHPTEGDGRWRRDSPCRKPAPGMLLEAAERLELDLGRSWIIGDSARDLEAGRRAGARGILVATGKGADAHEALDAEGVPHLYVSDVGAAVDLALAHVANAGAGRD